MRKKNKPLVLITGASGNIGSDLCRALIGDYRVIGLDIKPSKYADESIKCDLTSEDSIKASLEKIQARHGRKIAAVIHLAAYFDFTGKDSPLYEAVNIKGTKLLLETLQDFKVERFIYSSTMLVHEAGVPGQKINEDTPIKPRWVYPRSKAEAEKVLQKHHGNIPYTILRLAGIYDDHTAVPTLSHQIARIYERELKSHLYAGDVMAGQALIHEKDMIDVFKRVVERRHGLPLKNIMLVGEENVMSYQELQNRIGALIFGHEKWQTINVPEFVAKAGATLEMHMEPLVPDAIDQGEKPFIHPFMIDLSSDHYNLDASRVGKFLSWTPTHSIYNGLVQLIGNLKKNPAGWYERNKIIPPDWIKTAEEKKENPDRMRSEYETEYRRQHGQNLWVHFINLGLSFWLITAPFILGYKTPWLVWSDIGSGIFLALFSFLSLSWRFSLARWACCLIGLWLLCAPLVFWADSAAAYLNDTLIGMLIMGFAVLTPPVPGVSLVAATTGPTIPPGWHYSPSSWLQRLLVIVLAFVGFFISRYLAAYQLGHIEGTWEPFFTGSVDPKNGTEEIITSSISKAWPVPDAGLGAVTYALEILTGIIGASNRWRTMPWLVILFGIMIVPLGVVSMTFIIIQPIIIGTWCTLCLIAAAAMLIQIPYSIDELAATAEFLWRRKKQGRPLLRIFFAGDTDDGKKETVEDNFERPLSFILTEMFIGGVSLPWNLVVCVLVGIWLMFTRLSLGAGVDMANADHLMGSLVVTVSITALAEPARAVRFLLMPLGAALLITPFVYEASSMALVSSIICGLMLIVLSYRRGQIRNDYGAFDRFIF